MDEGSPCGLVLHHFLPVGQLGQVSVDKVDPSQGGVRLAVSSSLLAYTSRVAFGGIHCTFSLCDQTTASVSSSAVLQLAVLQSPSRYRRSSACPSV